MKNILIINPWKGRIGPNTFLIGFAEESISQGNEVTVIYPGKDSISNYLLGVGCNVRYFSIFELRHIRNPFVKIAMRFLREIALFLYLVRCHGGYDFVLVNTEVFSFSLKGLASQAPKHVVVHSLSFEASRRLSRIVFGIQSDLISSYIAVSRAVENGLNMLGVKKKVLVHYNGVDTAKFDKALYQSEESRAAGFTSILAVIHPVPHKGAHHLVEVIADISRHTESFHCTIIGWQKNSVDESYVNFINDLVRKYRLEEQITFVPNSEDIRRYYNQADIFIHPSESESFGYVIAEAMSFELPVIAFKVGGIIELVQDQQSGYLIEPYETTEMAAAAITLINNKALRLEMGRAGRKVIQERFSLKKNMSSLVATLCNSL